MAIRYFLPRRSRSGGHAGARRNRIATSPGSRNPTSRSSSGIRQIGQALLSLKEIEYFGWARTGDFYERVDKLIEDVLAKLEKRWNINDPRAKASSPA